MSKIMNHFIKHFCENIFSRNKSQKIAFWIEINGYWKAYGGIRAIITSRWLFLSLLLTLILYPKWCFDDWTSLSLSILPSLLGFSIGAMAVIFTLPSTALFDFIAWKGNSYYLEQAARFAHFVLVQITAILLSIFASTHYIHHVPKFLAFSSDMINIIRNFIGFLTFIYALFTGAATVFSLFGVAMLYNQSKSHTSGMKQDNNPSS